VPAVELLVPCPEGNLSAFDVQPKLILDVAGVLKAVGIDVENLGELVR
jgi:hypothetical protein